MAELRNIGGELLPQCVEVYQKAYGGAPWNETYPSEQLTRYLGAFLHSDVKCAYCLVEKECVIGVALGLIVPCFDAPFFRLEDFCIAPEFQRQGYGGRFLREIAAKVRTFGCDSILLGTQRGYPSHKLYLKEGFREIESVLMHKCLT